MVSPEQSELPVWLSLATEVSGESKPNVNCVVDLVGADGSRALPATVYNSCGDSVQCTFNAIACELCMQKENATLFEAVPLTQWQGASAAPVCSSAAAGFDSSEIAQCWFWCLHVALLPIVVPGKAVARLPGRHWSCCGDLWVLQLDLRAVLPALLLRGVSCWSASSSHLLQLLEFPRSL